MDKLNIITGIRSKNPSLVLIYATCQGDEIAQLLCTKEEFNEKYSIIGVIHNYQCIQNNKFCVNHRLIDSIDVFIYQPIDDSYGRHATDYIIQRLKPTCKLISIPYINNISLWPIIPSMSRDMVDPSDWNIGNENRIIINIGIIDKLIAEGASKQDVLDLYDTDAIDFEYSKRYSTTMEMLAKRESITDIKVCDYIDKNLKKERSFIYCNHPTPHVFVFMTNQILELLNLPIITENFPLSFQHYSRMFFGFPKTAVCHFGFEFVSEEEMITADKRYRDIIVKYLK